MDIIVGYIIPKILMSENNKSPKLLLWRFFFRPFSFQKRSRRSRRSPGPQKKTNFPFFLLSQSILQYKIFYFKCNNCRNLRFRQFRHGSDVWYNLNIMPELPEVQTIVSDLNKVLPGLKITSVWSEHERAIKYPKKFKNFEKEIVGERVLSVERRGKNVLINLSHNRLLLIHQKMTGHLLYGKFQIQN